MDPKTSDKAGSGPTLEANGQLPVSPAPGKPRTAANNNVERPSLPPWAWIGGLAALVLILLLIFVR
jgi:hypothetical protein